jgi:hypothetical protein
MDFVQHMLVGRADWNGDTFDETHLAWDEMHFVYHNGVNRAKERQ